MNSLLKWLGIMALLGILISCGRTSPVAPALPLDELSFSEDKIPLPSGEYIYRQSISINVPEAGQNLYSYRIRTLTEQLPPGLAADAEGWLFFRAQGANPAIPLSEPGNHRTIWTSQRALSLDFPSQEGKISDLLTRVEVRVQAPDGSISEHSSAFKSNRLFGSLIGVPFQNGANTGTGVLFELHELIGDIYVDGLYADHFMFRLNIVDSNQQIIEAGAWHSSLECVDLRKVLLNGTTDPAITANAEGLYTQFESYVVSRQGVEEATHHTVYFHAVGGYQPQALIYPRTIAGLGQYHYSISDYNYPADQELIPATSSHKSRHLWTGDTGLEAINSPDFRLHLRWGYNGQYGLPLANGSINVTNNPFDREIDLCLNGSNQNYGSSIVAFDLRLNNEPFPALGQFFDPEVVSHQDGSHWLRVQNVNDAARHCILANLPAGTVRFEVCAVDLQGVYSAPAVQLIQLRHFIPFASRSGILVVDDSEANVYSSPENIVDSLYTAAVPNTWGNVVTIDLASITTDQDGVRMSATTLQNYKAVVWHSDNPSASGYLAQHLDPLEIFLGNQGKLLISSTSKLQQNLSQFYVTASEFCSQRLGLEYEYYYDALSGSIAQMPFFQRALGQTLGSTTYTDIDLAFTAMGTASFNTLVNARQGLGTITYFNPEAGLDFLYKLGCKPVDYPVNPPTQTDYDLYSSKYVGYRYDQNGASVVLLGFPLSYMVPADVQVALQEILGSILGSSYALGGVK